MAEGTPLESVQVVNSGARVQIPPSQMCIRDRLQGADALSCAAADHTGRPCFDAVSYTHLDVYKRQARECAKAHSLLCFVPDGARFFPETGGCHLKKV